MYPTTVVQERRKRLLAGLVNGSGPEVTTTVVAGELEGGGGLSTEGETRPHSVLCVCLILSEPNKTATAPPLLPLLPWLCRVVYLRIAFGRLPVL